MPSLFKKCITLNIKLPQQLYELNEKDNSIIYITPAGPIYKKKIIF